MFLWLFILFVTVPLVELYVLIQLSDVAGVASTILLVLFTGFAGAALARSQGLRVIARIHETLGRGETPAAELVDGAMILFAGAVLLTPGLLTDIFGFVLLIPPSRAVIGRALFRWFKSRMVVQFQSGPATAPPESAGPGPVGSEGPVIIDAEYERINDPE